MIFSELKDFLDYTSKKINPVMEELINSHIDRRNRKIF